MISIRDISIFADGHLIVGGVSFDLAPGECTVISGESGAGKSALLEILAGISRPERGSIVVDSIDLFASPSYVWNAYYNSLGIVTQLRDLLPITVRENIALPLDARQRKNAPQMVQQSLKQWGLESCATKKPYQLSKNEALRTVLARATIHSPSILLLDDPLSDLSQQETQQALSLLTELQNQGASLCIAARDASAFSSLRPTILKLQHGTTETSTNKNTIDPVAQTLNKQSAKKTATKVAKIRVQ